MKKLVIIIALLFYLPVEASYNNEIEALIILMKYQNSKYINNGINKSYSSIPINSCKIRVRVKYEKKINFFDVNICNKRVLKI